MKNKVIGLVGVKQAGKTTASKIIEKEFDVVNLALADKMKDVCSKVFNIPKHSFTEQHLKELPFIEGVITLDKYSIGAVLEGFNINLDPRSIDSLFEVCNQNVLTPRQLMQKIGTEVLRKAGGEDIHCESLKLDNVKLNVISDIRFFNEFNYFNNNYDFLPLYIKNEEAEKSVKEDSHASEKGVFDFRDLCVEINNNATIEELEKKLVSRIKGWLYA